MAPTLVGYGHGTTNSLHQQSSNWTDKKVHVCNDQQLGKISEHHGMAMFFAVASYFLVGGRV